MDNDNLAMENARYTSFRQRNFKDLFMENAKTGGSKVAFLRDPSSLGVNGHSTIISH